MAKYATIPVGTYTGSLLGKSLSKQIGIAEATGGDINQAIRGSLIQTGVATGKINPGQLSSQDAALLQQTTLQAGAIPVPHVSSSAGHGILGVLGAIAKPFVNTAGDFVSAAESVPAGVEQGLEAAYRSVNPIANKINAALGMKQFSTPKGENLGGLAKGIAQATVHDFTHFDINHPLYPILDVAALAGGGATALARGGAGLSRLATEGRLAEEPSLLARTLGRTPAIQAASPVARRLAKLSTIERPDLVVTPRAAALAKSDTELPSIPRHYSISPARQILLERPLDRLLGSRIGSSLNLPFFPEQTSLSDLRTSYALRKMGDTVRSRVSAGSIENTVKRTQGVNHAMKALIEESPNQTVAAEKFDALVLLRQIGAEFKTPAERQELLDEYIDRILKPNEPVEGVPRTIQGDQVRKMRLNLYQSPDFRRFFSEPTEGMLHLRDEWDKAILEGHRTLGIDPHVLLQRSLGPAALLRDMTPEELLREQPELIQRSTAFATGAKDLEKAVKDAEGDVEAIPEQHMIPFIARELPDSIPIAERNRIVEDAVHSFAEDLNRDTPRRDLLNNAGEIGYLPGNTIAQKVVNELLDHGIEPEVALRYVQGGLTNYFPMVDATNSLKVRPSAGRITRNFRRLQREVNGGYQGGPQRLGQYRRENFSRILRANSIGVAPYASFLHEADLKAFRAGIDRRDPETFIRHISTRERLLIHRKLSDPLIERLALKRDGKIVTVNSEEEIQNYFGDKFAAAKYRAVPIQALRTVLQSEDEGASRVAQILKENPEGLTPAAMDQIDGVIDEGAQDAVREVADHAINNRSMIVLPKTFVDNIINHARVLDSGSRVLHLWQAFINRWRTAVLAYMPSWLLRTSVGHGVVLWYSGTTPHDFARAVNYFGHGFRVPGTEVHLSRGLGRETPEGINQGIPHADLGQDAARRAMQINRIAQWTTQGVHTIANAQRRAGFLASLEKVTKAHLTELDEAFKFPRGFDNYRNIDDVIQNHPDLVHHALNELDRVSYTFGQMSPWERRLAKNVLPFWGWYKFITKFVYSMPATYPGRALAVARVGQIGEAAQDELGAMPDWLRASIMFNTHNLAGVHYISMLGLNPLGDVADPSGGFQGLVRLGQLSPIIQAALEGMGYNTLTGGLEEVDPSSGIVEVNGRFLNTNTGQEYDNLDAADAGHSVSRFIGGLLRTFPEARIGELIYTGGHPIYPESIPVVDEHPIPGATQKPVSIPLIAAQYAGVQPKTYNLQKYQLRLVTDLRRAITQQRDALLKEKRAAQGLPIP